MTSRTIYITEFDVQRLSDIIKDPSKVGVGESESLQKLKSELATAKIVAPKNIPSDCITMNSVVLYKDADTGEEDTITLVFPSDSDPAEGKISVLAPIGMAMIGYRVGDVITWKVPDGVRHLKIEKICYQPEAAGDYHL